MAVTCRWDRKCGEVITYGNSKMNIYTGGNCVAVFVYEYKQEDELIRMLWHFWSDKEHFNAMMKDKDTVTRIGETFKSMRVNTYYKEFTNLAIRLLKETSLKKITLYYEEPKETKMAKKIKVVIKKPYETAYVAEIENNIKEYQNLVDGYIECVSHPSFPDLSIICNEEGKLIGLDPNIIIPEYNDVIMGTAIIVGTDFDDFGSVSDDIIDEVVEDANKRSL